MSAEKPQGVTSTIGGWIKAGLASLCSLLAGAVLMYATPLVNKAIKPPKPVANFAAQSSGLTVDFNNRSTGGVQGWWDFGDGSALVPFDPDVENIKHAYARPGSYNVKLSLANLIGEENERTAAVKVDEDMAAAAPIIEQFEVKPIDPREIAPAVYRITGKVKNAGSCILSSGDRRPMEVLDAGVCLERYVQFNDMGSYTIRLAALNGKQLVEKTQTVYVGANDGSRPLAKLLVSYEAVRVERITKSMWIHAGWQGDTRPATLAFRKERLADPGCKILSATLTAKGAATQSVRNVRCEIAPDKAKVIVTGELVREASALPSWVGEVKVAMERRSAAQTIQRGEIAMAVDLNTLMRIPMPPLEDSYEILGKKATLQLWDGARKVWEGDKAVSNVSVSINNRNCMATVVPQSDGFLVTVSSIGPIIQPVGFERNPITLPKR